MKHLIYCQRCQRSKGEYVHTDDDGVKYIFCRKCYAKYLEDLDIAKEKALKAEERANIMKERFWKTSKVKTSEDGIRSVCHKRGYMNGQNVKYRISFMKNNEEVAHCWSIQNNVSRFEKNWIVNGKLPSYTKRNEVFLLRKGKGENRGRKKGYKVHKAESSVHQSVETSQSKKDMS